LRKFLVIEEWSSLSQQEFKSKIETEPIAQLKEEPQSDPAKAGQVMP